uniref:Uncharacterized protein n=1 Tax=Solanum tuberosum TaxID=4113 RepID=M1C9J9_SOLTU
MTPNCTSIHLLYISFYQEDKSCDQVILTFAKLHFNTLQKMHKRELCDITR